MEETRQKGLFVSSLAYDKDLPAVVLDDGTGFTDQHIFWFEDDLFPVESIRQEWENGFYITATAGEHSL